MLQIPNHIYLNNNESYDAFAATYLPPGNSTGIVALAKQHEAILWLNADTINGQFYFIVDVKSNTVVHCSGVYRWLGYADNRFTTKKYKEILCPAHAVAQSYYGMAAWQALINNRLPLQFMQPVCAALIALRKSDGGYVYCRRLCSPFQLTADGRVTEYLCRFTMISPFENEACSTWLHGNGKHLHEAAKAMYAAMQTRFEGGGFFSPQEMRVLKMFAHTPLTTSVEIAKTLRIEKATVNIYNKRIIGKAEKLFTRPFANAKDVAAYIKRMRLV